MVDIILRAGLPQAVRFLPTSRSGFGGV